MTKARKAELRRLAKRECAEILEAAIGINTDSYTGIHDPEERLVIQDEMHRVADELNRRSGREALYAVTEKGRRLVEQN